MTLAPEPLLDLLDRGAVRAAIQAARSLDEADRTEPAVNIVRGWARAGSGDLDGAKNALRPLVAGLEGGEDRRERAHALLALGVACVMGGEADAGTALLERALSLHREAWPRAQALRFLALALEQRGAWEGAAARYVAAASTYAEIGNIHGQGSALYGAATALAELGAEAEAHTRLTAAVDVLRSPDTMAALGPALTLLASFSAKADGVRALALLDEAEAIAVSADRGFTLDAKVRRADVLLTLGRADEALPLALQAREALPPASTEQVWVEHLVARAFLRLGRTAEAAELLAADAGLSGAARLERDALRLALAAEADDDTACDRALAGLDRAVQGRWRRRGVDEHLIHAADALAPRSPEGATRALHAAVALGAALDPLRDRLQVLRARGTRVPLGPLWLEAQIGRGGMGEVWRARHRDGGEVAVKLLRADGTGEHAALFSAEIQAIARLDHPNVVRVLAALPVGPATAVMLDRPPGGVALVMELVPGGSLDGHLSGWRWPEARALLTELLDALAHAHARGVLHLDLKPANVLVDDTGAVRRPRLTDFGLAGLARRDDDRKALFGTPTYMAPEQGRLGAVLGPATDLYAFGCLAWHLLSGRPVFDVSRPEEQLERHRSGQLPRFVPATPVPADVEGWLRTLLARRPEDRFACAADARWALACLGDIVEAGLAGSASSVCASDTTFDLRALATPPVHGSATTALRGPVQRTDAGEATTIALGTGPTELDPTPPSEGPLPLAPRLVAPMRADWREPTKRPPLPFLPGAGEGLFAWRIGRLVGREAERDRLWGALAAVHADGRGRAVWILGADGLGRTALARWLAANAHATGAARVHTATNDGIAATEAAVRRAPADRPGLVILDDAVGTAGPLLIRSVQGLPVLVVVTTRVLPDEADTRDVELIDLAPLSDAEIAALVDDRLPLDRALSARLAARAAGSPAFAVALLTDLLRQDALEIGPEGFRERAALALPLPDDLRGLWTERVDALAPPGTPRRAAWELAAVFGVDIDLSAWGRACARLGLLPDASAFAPLERDGWVEQGAGRLRFRVPALQEALRDGATASGRALAWNSAAADVLADLPAQLDAYARHLAAAGRHLEALRPLRRAAAEAINATRLEACAGLVDLWDRSADALGYAPDDPRRAAPIVVRVHLALHTRVDPYPLLERGLRLVTGRDPEAECHLVYTRGWVLARDGRHPEAEDDYLRAVVLARSLDQSEMLAVAQLGLAATLFALGRDAMPLVEQTRALLDGLDHLRFRLDACAGRGLVKLGRVDEGRAYLLRAVAGARAGNAPDVEADALTDLADLDVGAGALGAAVLCLEAAVAALSRTSSDKALEAGVRLAALLLCDGRDDEARATLGPIRQRFGWRLRPAVAAEIALVERALDGDPAGAEPVAEAASGRAAESPALRRLHAVVSERRARV